MSKIDPTKISIDTIFGPIGSCGFRTGWWKAKYEGRKFRFYGSISHYSDLKTQNKALQAKAARYLESSPTLIEWL